MKVRVLYSGGQDSSLSAVLLEPFFDVELVTCSFGSDAWRHAQKAAGAIGFPFKVLELGPEVMDGCVDLILKHGYPRYGINYVHRAALEAVAAEGAEHVSDGTRRDDHSPVLTMPEVRSLEMRYGVSYVRPLAGYGKKAIGALVKRHFEVVEGPDIEKADYEAEIRSSIKQMYGERTVKRLFPTQHPQSRVTRRLQK
jgi:predicted subunit of tRNA(5-methylaminomethyl-2-thiouridylate) methyltransferase